jgi:glycosyltransferase involved in cell wall biosynthesis
MWIVLPAYNESKILKSVIEEIQAAGYKNIIVVDDGSTITLMMWQSHSPS